MYKFTLFTIISLLFFIIFSNFSVSAHGAGVSFPKDVGEYRLEFEYDVPEVLSGEVNAFIFRILNKKDLSPVVFDSVLVRLEKKEDNSTFLVTRLAPDELQEGVARLTAVLPKGDFLVNLSFKKDDTKLAETSYDLSVKEEKKSVSLFVAALLSFIAGIVTSLLVLKLKKNKNEAKH